jgi:hypothetical protein
MVPDDRYLLAMGEVLICRNTEGETVVEVDLDDTTMTVAEVVSLARNRGADLVWAHGGDPAGYGFVPKPGYAHLSAEHPVPGGRPTRLQEDLYGPLLARAYFGMWGHKWVDPTQPLPSDDTVVLGLYENSAPIGICRVWVGRRLVDQPGVVPERREPENSVRLLGAACALLGAGPVEVDSWGESAETLSAWRRLGFEITEQHRGWELRL